MLLESVVVFFKVFPSKGDTYELDYPEWSVSSFWKYPIKRMFDLASERFRFQINIFCFFEKRFRFLSCTLFTLILIMVFLPFHLDFGDGLSSLR